MTDEGMTEAPRLDPGFRIYVEHPERLPWREARVDVTDAVMDAYDIAVNSLDFGSGFLSTEEVGNLRALGKAIGAKRFDYQNDKCLRCGHEYHRHQSPNRRCTVGDHWVKEGVKPGELSDPLDDSKKWVLASRGCPCEGFVRPL